MTPSKSHGWFGPISPTPILPTPILPTPILPTPILPTPILPTKNQNVPFHLLNLKTVSK